MPNIILLFILLDAGMPVASWIGIILTALITLLSFLIRDAYNRITKEIAALWAEIKKNEDAYQSEVKTINEKIHEVHYNILNRLEDIKKDFNALRR